MNFDPIKCEEYVRMLVDHDEVDRALLVLENVPAFYRDNLPDNLVTLRKKILRAIFTPHAYTTGDFDSHFNMERSKWIMSNHTRAVLVRKEVEYYNEKNLVPHIIDMGPGEYFLPAGLMSLGLKFTYKALGLNYNAKKIAEEVIKDVMREEALSAQPEIFIANEIIEHLRDPQDIAVEMNRHCFKEPERIHLSTPRYNFDLMDGQWDKPLGCGHLRAYTPSEFIAIGEKLFPSHKFQLYYSDSSQPMSLRGVPKNSSELISLL